MEADEGEEFVLGWSVSKATEPQRHAPAFSSNPEESSPTSALEAMSVSRLLRRSNERAANKLKSHGKEFNSFRGRTRSKPLREFRLHRQEKFLCICDLLDIWEWELRVMDIQEGATDE